MPLTSRTRLINPRLGTYFGIFTSAFVGLFMLLLILEQLGTPRDLLSIAMLAGPILLYSAIGIATFTREPYEYFAAGRRVPAMYTGLALSLSAMGATGLVAITGAFFLAGFDILCLMLGGLAGFVVMAVLLAPFLRKFGAFTIPTYLGRRFDSRSLRLLAAALLAVPMILMLAAELRIGALAAALLSGQSMSLTLLLLVVAIIATVTLGGMRSLAWSSVAEAIAALLALLVPVAIVAVLVTYLPLPQLTTGPLLRSLVRRELAQGLPIAEPPAFAFQLPGEGFSAIAKPFATPFVTVGSGAFVAATLTIMAGIAAAPWLLPRVASTPGVYEARKSLGWATLLFGVIMLTIASVAVFMRDFLMDIVVARDAAPLPSWVGELANMGFASVDNRAPQLGMTSFAFQRDAVLFSLPVAAGMPVVLLHLALAGAIAAALAAAGAVVVTLGHVLAEDVVAGLSWQPVEPQQRMLIARLSIAGAAALGGLIATLAPTDPLKLMLWSLALTGSTAFPVLVLSIWWKRLNTFGATAGLSTGFAVATLAILAGEAGILGWDGALAGIFGIPSATLAAVTASLATPVPSRLLLELVHEIRVPGGHIVYDHEMRMLRMKRRQR